MHCNNERRIHETLRRLGREPAYLETFSKMFLQNLPSGMTVDAAFLESRWSRFVELSALDPYTKERVKLALQSQLDPVLRAWVEAAVQCCKENDPEFCLALEESMVDRFLVAAGLMRSEGLAN